MRIYAALAVLMVMLVKVSFAQQNIGLLSSEVRLPLTPVVKADLLDSIEKRLGIHFSYNPEWIGATDTVSFSTEKVVLLDLISQLTDSSTTGFHLLDNQLVFYPLKSDDVSRPAIPVDPFVVVGGMVTDAKDKSPVPYCNIAVTGKGLGAMSNNDGKFLIKIPASCINDTLRFSCMGYMPYFIPVAEAKDSQLAVTLSKKIFNLKTIDVVHYQPSVLLQKYFDNVRKNYENEYNLFTTFYREIVREDNDFTDVSEAVLHVLKAPYSSVVREDMVKFLKGRKSSNVLPFNDIRFKLRGGPYYITKLDVVKNEESFINPDFISLFNYSFERKTLLAGRETAIVAFSPVYNLRELLYEGLLYFDIETGALARAEFNYTRQGLKEARRLMIEKEPRNHKAIPAELSYVVEYTFVQGKWYLLSAQSSMEIKIIDREKRQKTNFYSTAEMLVTSIEKGDLLHFSRKEIFRPGEFFTEKITSYDEQFWSDYNVIEPEEDLQKAVKNFDDHNLIISTD